MRKEWYKITTTSPANGMFDGIIKVQEANDPKTKFREVIENRLKDSTRIKLTIEQTDTLNGNVNVRIRTIATDSILETDPRLFMVILQDSMPYGINGPLYFVGRKIVPPDTFGLPFRHITVNDTFDTTLSVTNNWHSRHLGVITFIQDISTKKVIQAVIKRGLY